MTAIGFAKALRRPRILEIVTEHARAQLTGLLPKAVSTIERIMDGDNMAAALNAARHVQVSIRSRRLIGLALWSMCRCRRDTFWICGRTADA